MGGSRRWGDELPTGVRKCSSPTDYCIFRRPMYEIAGEIDCQLCKSIQLLGSSPQTSLHGLYCWIPIILLHGQFLDPPLTDCAATTFENRLLHVYFSSCLSWWLLYFEFSPSLASMYACRLFLIDCYVTEALRLRHTITAGCIDGEVHDLISVQPCHNTRSLCTITLARPSPTLSSLKITNRSFSMLHLVYGTNSPLISVSLVRHSLLHFHLSHMAFHQPLTSSLTRSVFHSELKLNSKSFPP